MSRTVSLPVGFHPGWENEDETINSEGAEMRSVADSLVIFQSLRQSRDKWLTSTFPKFSVRGRGGKPPEVTPPPHHTKCLGKFELTIGPHIFQNTAVYEVSYLPHAEPTPPTAQSIPSAASISPIQQPGPADQSAHNSQHSSHESLAPNISVTPELSSKVNAALATNPILRNLFHLVGSGRATEDQVATLAALVHSMGNLPPDPRVPPQPPHQSSTHEPSASFLSSPPSVAPLRTKPFDVVIEFQEKLPDKWIIPRGYALLETTPSSTSSTKLDAILTVSPLINIGPEPSGILPPGISGPDTASPVVKLHWTGLIQPVIDLFARWCNDEQNIAENKGKLQPPEIRKRVYLPHHLPEGELLTRIRTAAHPYTMKSIKPAHADGGRTRRRNTSRKQSTSKVTKVAAKPVHPSATTISVTSTATPSTPTIPITLAADQKPNEQTSVSPARPRKQSKAKAPTQTPVVIACRACGQRDVPLMMGGRFCRICIETGKAVDQIPAALARQSVRSPTSNPMYIPSVT